MSMNDDASTLSCRYHIQIANTERRTSANALHENYIVYWIECREKTPSSNEKRSPATRVFRRYSDFETLANYLIGKYSWIIVPVLPEKTISYPWAKSFQDRTSLEVVERRRLLLERFLAMLTAHHILSSDPLVQSFLFENDRWKEIVETTHSTSKSDSLIPSFKLNLMAHERTKEKRLVDAYQYAIDLNSCLHQILRSRAKLSDRIYLFNQSHCQYGQLFSRWSRDEETLGDSLQRAGHFLDSYAGQIEEFLHEQDAVMDLVKCQTSYCHAIKSVVEKHEQLLDDNRKQEKRVSIKRTQRDAYINGKVNFSIDSLKSKLFGQNEEKRYEKIETMDADVNDAVLHSQNADLRLREFNKNAFVELDVYKVMKQEQFQQFLYAYCLLQARIAKMAFKTWTNIRDCFCLDNKQF